MMRLVVRSALLSLVLSVPAFAQTGGPDGFGYTYAPTTLDFVPLAGDPGATLLNIGAEGEASVDLPFAFPFYGGRYTQARVGENGGVRLGPFSGDIVGANTPMPTSALSSSSSLGAPDLALFWDNLDVVPNGAVYAATVGPVFILSWEGVAHDNNVGAASFQVHLDADGGIELHALDLDFGNSNYNDGASATVGIQDRAGLSHAAGNALLVAHNQATVLGSGDAIRFEPPACVDVDADGFGPGCVGGEDCALLDSAGSPASVEVMCDGEDDDCDGGVDEVVLSRAAALPTPLPFSHLTPPAQSTITVVETGSVGSLTLSFTADHSWVSDVTATLQSPAGTVLPLFAGVGASSDDFVATTLDDDASMLLESGVGPFTGAFRPMGALSAFDGEPITGVWTLSLSDHLSGDDGSFIGWTLQIGVVGGPADADADGVDLCTDCDDLDAARAPGQPELCDGVDNDCDALTTAAPSELDADGDGFFVCDPGECDDGDATRHAGASELCDGLDTDCDGSIGFGEVDGDGDTFFLCDSGECDDTDAWSYAGASELCDGADNDCDSALGPEEADVDGDSFIPCDGDCDDSDDTIAPGAAELCDGADTDCDPATVLGLSEADADNDGHRLCAGDCDDAVATVFPGASEICDERDSDCDGTVPAAEADLDGDGASTCFDGDCDDADAARAPTIPESCNGIDDDCDGWMDDGLDADNDGVSLCVGDCDDGDALVHPGATEICDGLDDDCDGAILIDEGTDADADGQPLCLDCDDAEPLAGAGIAEVCDGVDNDCDGGVDEEHERTLIGGGGPAPGNAVTMFPAADTGHGWVSQLVVALDITHPWDAELELAIIEPWGAWVELSVGRGGSGDDFSGTTFDDAAATPIALGVPPFLGAFQPEQMLSSLDDAPLHGLWRLQVIDAFAGLDGTLNSWTVSATVGGPDVDGDGATRCFDCDEGDSGRSELQPELCNGLDDDCDPDTDDAVDGDGDGGTVCDGDCDDGAADIGPGMLEICDGLDDDCDGSLAADEQDADGDGLAACAGDCDPGDATVGVGPELCDDALDNDCDGDVDGADSDCAPGDDDDSAGDDDDSAGDDDDGAGGDDDTVIEDDDSADDDSADDDSADDDATRDDDATGDDGVGVIAGEGCDCGGQGAAAMGLLPLAVARRRSGRGGILRRLWGL